MSLAPPLIRQRTFLCVCLPVCFICLGVTVSVYVWVCLCFRYRIQWPGKRARQETWNLCRRLRRPFFMTYFYRVEGLAWPPCPAPPWIRYCFWQVQIQDFVKGGGGGGGRSASEVDSCRRSKVVVGRATYVPVCLSYLSLSAGVYVSLCVWATVITDDIYPHVAVTTVCTKTNIIQTVCVGDTAVSHHTLLGSVF